MLNHYPAWKYLLLIIIVGLGLIYAAPNLYGENPAVQISHRVNIINQDEIDKVTTVLKNLNIDYRSIEMGDGFILVRFANEDQQLKAASDIKEVLQDKDSRYSVALNLAPATPDWLRSLNALPMYLGLDLRGGVHFLMEVDMESAISKAVSEGA